MDAGAYLQIAAGVCEVGGVLTVAWDIAGRREQFTHRPSLFRRARDQVRRTAAKLIPRRRDAVVHVVTAGAVAMAGSGGMRVRATVGFGSWEELALEERIDRLRHASENHEHVLNEIDKRLDGEEADRRAADERLEGRVVEVHRELGERIELAAAGGLRLQTFGVVLLLVGIGLGTLGNVIS